MALSMQQFIDQTNSRIESLEKSNAELKQDLADQRDAVYRELVTIRGQIDSPSRIEVPSTPVPKSLVDLGIAKK